jgi:hypothetical protein
MGQGRNAYRVLMGEPEGKRTLQRTRRRWEDGIKMDLKEIGWEGGVGWSGFTWLGKGIAGGCCECGDEPSDSDATDLVMT